MKLSIRTRLTLQFTYIVTFILILFSFIIYYFSANYRESEFYSRLETKASNTAKLLIEVNEVDNNLLKIIDRNTLNALSTEKVIVYDHNNAMIYNSLDENNEAPLPTGLLNEIRLSKKVYSHDGKKEVVGILHSDKFGEFVIIASALDKYGRNKLRNLRLIIITGFFISIGLTIFIGRIYAYKALKPISDVVKQVDRITINSLNTLVDVGNGTDEIAQLAITFNKMLERLISAFEMQRSFVSNASHELRTPLTSITGQIEVSLMKPRSQHEYEAILESILEDIRNLNALSNGLLDLAKVNSDISAISLVPVRIDEILWETRTDLIQRKKDYNISVKFGGSIEDERELIVLGNEQLLKTAIINLMDNACKFSPDKSVKVYLFTEAKFIEIEVVDNGIGIEPQAIESIFNPFFRAKNAKNIPGSGLGLSLTGKIIQIHHGTIVVESQLRKGTKVTIKIPSIS